MRIRRYIAKHKATLPRMRDDYSVHAADQEGGRLCGTTRGMKTVFRSPGAVTCPACLGRLTKGEDA